MSTFDTTLANLGINRTNGSNGANVLPASAANQTLGQADFLKLMTAQLQNQDPFSPVDNTQMVAQMAQFSSLSGISEMNTTLKAIADKLAGTSSNDAMAYVGKTVLTAGDTAFGRTTGGIAGGVELDDAASDVKVSISDASGNVLKTMDLGASNKGTVSFDWDGKTDAGADAGAGPFKVTATASASGKAVTSRTLVWAPVTSVSMPSSGNPQLNVAGVGTIDMSAVRSIG